MDILASAHIPAYCISDLFPELLLFFFPLAAVVKEVLPCLDKHTSTLTLFDVFSMSEVFQVYFSGRMSGL